MEKEVRQSDFDPSSEPSTATISVRHAGIQDIDSIVTMAMRFEAELDIERVGFTVDNIAVLHEEVKRLYKCRLVIGMPNALKHIVLLAENSASGAPLGFVVGHVPDPKPDHDFYALLRGNYVMPDYRGRQIGANLYQEFKKIVSGLGASSVQMEVQENGMGYIRLTKNAQPIKDILLPDGTKRIRFNECLK
jgi:ribosomal protein S18 acetylase RimI-like enzyme